MTERQRKLVERAGLSVEDFQPREKTDKERIAELESALMELAQIITVEEAEARG